MVTKKQVPKPEGIQNWTVFGTHMVKLDLYKIEKGYQPAITYILDNGEDLPEEIENQKAITIFLDSSFDKPKDAIRVTATSIASMYEKIAKQVDVYDGDTNTKSFDLEEVMKINKKKSVFW
jgi:thymidylate synthase